MLFENWILPGRAGSGVKRNRGSGFSLEKQRSDAGLISDDVRGTTLSALHAPDNRVLYRVIMDYVCDAAVVDETENDCVRFNLHAIMAREEEILWGKKKITLKSPGLGRTRTRG